MSYLCSEITPKEELNSEEMKIEQAIKQKAPFKSEYHRMAVNLMFTSNWLNERFMEHLKPFDLTPQQFNVLRILRGAGEPISTSIIRDRMLDKMSDTSRIVERLCQKELVNRRVCPKDRRLVDITISEKGLALLAELDTNNDLMPNLLQALTEEECRQLNDFLDKVRGDS